MPDETHIDLRQRVAALEQMLVARTAERDQAREYQTATRFTHPPPGWGRICALPPPPGWGRARVGVIALIEVGVTDRLAVEVMPRTDPW